ncbi:transposase [Serpentinicella sp. ANB-PHB4]|uniref:REP-associated tyrosine transposase n=1 Tax=Serpentinicella sp. ANB-PHB4 TaxID=3074076 RepID=UPI0028626923|nr:transposase [Serpentinicella sp. ANB-PHB4]MDR5659791.1 transposase [Serpentinicella sp. ANB-PHB4]
MSLKHYYEENCYYFITTITENRESIFKDPIICDLLIHILTQYKLQCPFNLKAFVVMPDHIHLLLQPTGKENISEIMKKVKGSFSRYYNRLQKRTGSVFQKGFYDMAIRNDNQLLEVMEYIHHNPCKKGIDLVPEDYTYSSYNFYFNADRKFELLMMESFE